MKVFERPNFVDSSCCPICGTKDDLPVLLVPVLGTEKGSKMQAVQYHVECIDIVRIDLPVGHILVQQVS